MLTSAKLGLAALMAALLLSTAVSTAPANRLSVSNQAIRATWNNLEFTAPGVFTVRCRVTLEGSFHERTFSKSHGSLIGAVSRAFVKEESCVNGLAQPKRLPWHITFESFTGTLPRMRSVRLLLSRFRFLLRFSSPIVRCEYGTASDNIIIDASLREDGEVLGFAPVEGSNTISREEPSDLLCPATGRVIGPEGQMMLLATTDRIRITLI